MAAAASASRWRGDGGQQAYTWKVPVVPRDPFAPRRIFCAEAAPLRTAGRAVPALPVPTPPSKPPRTPVAFLGICDVKYDPELPAEQRVRVLELGDARASRFSGHGAHIRERFEEEYCYQPAPIKRQVLVENKRMTHDRFVREGFERLRPRCRSYLRRYEPGLADQILADLSEGCAQADLVVLKLCNRCRGAGVVVASARQLDEVLEKLLIPPQGADLDDLICRSRETALASESADSRGFEEQCLHWWSNECPVFLAEACCRSMLVAAGDGAGDDDARFDGTLRVAFALRRAAQREDRERDGGEVADEAGEGGAEQAETFTVDWLGGYWKLPCSEARGASQRIRRDAVAEAGEPASLEEGLEELRAQVVSSFNSAEKRTAPVLPEHLAEVYAALAPVLPRIFQAGPLAVQEILGSYRTSEPLVCAFTLARSAAGMRAERLRRAEGLLDLARGLVPASVRNNGGQCPSCTLPERAVLSYIDRNLAVCKLLQLKRWDAMKCATDALRWLPTNASAHYILGRCHEEQSAWHPACESQGSAMALDPDFKLPYLSLAACALRDEACALALRAGRACLRRHPDCALAHMMIGQAVYMGLTSGCQDWPPAGAADEDWKACGRDSCELARRKLRSLWTAPDERILQYFQADSEDSTLSKEPVRPWKVNGWRP